MVIKALVQHNISLISTLLTKTRIKIGKGMTLALASKIFFLWLAIAAAVVSPLAFSTPEPGLKFALFFIEHKRKNISHIKAFSLSLILVSTIMLLVWANGAFSDL